MAWKKLGHVFVAQGEEKWMSSHAANPQTLHLRESVYRIFFSARDSRNQSHVGFVDIDLESPLEILQLSEAPVLSPGELGLFDDSGVLPSCIADLPLGLGFFYIGISLGKSVPFHSFTGLAVLDKSRESASRVLQTPILDRSPSHPYSGGAVCVLRGNKRGRYHMWFESCEGWNTDAGEMSMRLGIRHAVSDNGVVWGPGELCLPPTETISYVGSPCVLQEGGGFRMWFSFKTEGKYRIGYAESLDGIEWTIDPEGSGLTVSNSGWDSDEVAYPHVFRHGDNLFMLYNGNHYGKTGFGIAICDEGPQ